MPNGLRRFGAFLVALVGLLALLPVSPAHAQGRGRAGDFDFWVLSLSWSPSWCEATGDARRDVQCARPFGFVVHGLWPQWERGFPSACPTREPPPSPEVIRTMLDVMPSPSLVRHEWEKHGTCSGLSAEAYFRVIRRLFAAITIPAEHRLPDRPRMIAPAEVERAFVAANRGLDGDEIAVLCDGRRLQEVRICVNKDLSGFRRCPEVDRRACRLDRAFMPAARIGR
jgi:ribonuclease T2